MTEYLEFCLKNDHIIETETDMVNTLNIGIKEIWNIGLYD